MLWLRWVLVLCLACPTYAADSNGQFAIKGAGLQTCSALLHSWDNKTNDLALYAGWIDGYLTGMNQHFDDTFDAAPWQTPQTLLGLSRELCRNRDGNEKFMNVFNDLMRDLLPLRLTTKSNATGLSNGSSALVLYTKTIAQIEQRLTSLGYNPGKVDGVYDEQSRKALEGFQGARDIEITGIPDQQTLFALFTSPQ